MRTSEAPSAVASASRVAGQSTPTTPTNPTAIPSSCRLAGSRRSRIPAGAAAKTGTAAVGIPAAPTEPGGTPSRCRVAGRPPQQDPGGDRREDRDRAVEHPGERGVDPLLTDREQQPPRGQPDDPEPAHPRQVP